MSVLGASTDSNASLHLANVPGRQQRPDDFGKLFDDFRRDTGSVRESKAGSAGSFLIPQREMVDYA